MKKIKQLIFFGIFLGLILGLAFYFKKDENNINENNSEEIIKKVKKKNYSELKIGYITDLHCYSKQDSDTGKWELNWRCSQPMGNFIKMMNEDFHPDVVVDGGDLVDGRDDQGENLYPVVFNMFDKITSVPHYHILGNHETNCFTKDIWRGFTGYETNYYYQDINDHRLIFLDGNLKSSEDGKGEDTSPENRYYPGYLGEEQTVWLESVLKESEDKNVLVFVHQPPLEKTLVKESKELFVDGKEVRNLFSEYQVSAVFSGHIEEMCYLEEDGVDYYVLQGVHKSNGQLLEEDAYKDKGSFYEITVNKQGKPEVKMFYKDKNATEYETLIVNSETAICNNESIQHPETYEALVDEQEKKEETEEGEDE